MTNVGSTDVQRPFNVRSTNVQPNNNQEPINNKHTSSAAMERAHKAKLASLGCAMCHHLYGVHEPGPVELHHLRTGGWGKGDYRTLIPLCVNHHRGDSGIHHMGTKAWEREFGITQKQLLEWVDEQIA